MPITCFKFSLVEVLSSFTFAFVMRVIESIALGELGTVSVVMVFKYNGVKVLVQG